jgi:hypothetical protein
MKINLTKEEWEFLHYQFSNNSDMLTFEENDYSVCDTILEKLGSEWVDDKLIPKIEYNHI